MTLRPRAFLGRRSPDHLQSPAAFAKTCRIWMQTEKDRIRKHAKPILFATISLTEARFS